MKKSFYLQNPVRTRNPGGVPTDSNIAAMKLVQKPADPKTIARLMAHDDPRLTIESIVNDLGMDAGQRNDWITYLNEITTTAPNELVLRQEITSKSLDERMDGALRSAILQRSLSYWRDCKKSLLQIMSPEDLLEKAEARGGSYHRRVPKPGGGYTYYYDEEKYKNSKQAHTNGKETQHGYISGKIQKCIEEAGGKGCGPESFSDLVKKYGAKTVANVFKKDPKYSFKKGKFFLQKNDDKTAGDKPKIKKSESRESLRKSEPRKYFITEEIEIPEDFAVEVLGMNSHLSKSRDHKYIRRVPYTGASGKQKYRYYYKVTGGGGVGSHDEMVSGAKFKVAAKDGHEEGHLTVESTEGDNVTVKHDETGKTYTLSKKALSELLHRHHLEAIKTTYDKAKEIHEAAQKHGSEKQQARAKERLDALQSRFDKILDVKKDEIKDKEKLISAMVVDFLSNPRRSLTVASTARSFRIDKVTAGKILQGLEDKGRIHKDGNQYAGGKAKEEPKLVIKEPVKKPTPTAKPHVEDAPKTTEVKHEAEKVADKNTFVLKESKTKKKRKILAVEQGEHVWGSRADMFASIENSEDLGKLNTADQAKFATKKNLLVKKDVDEYLGEGRTPGNVLLRNAVEAAISAKAPDNLDDRKRYMDGIAYVQRSLDGAYTEDDIQDFVDDMYHLSIRFKKVGKLSGDQVGKLVDEYMVKKGHPPKMTYKEYDQLRDDRNDLAREYNAMHERVFGENPEGETRDDLQVMMGRIRMMDKRLASDSSGYYKFEAIQEHFDLEGGTSLSYRSDGSVTVFGEDYADTDSMQSQHYRDMVASLGPNFYKLVNESSSNKKPKKYRDALATVRRMRKEDDETQVQTVRKELEPKKRDTPRKRQFKWEREVPGEIQRTGGESVDVADTKKLASDFGFANVQFGNWVTESDAESHIKGAHGALYDLSDIMGINRKTISLNGRLSIAFGARGSGKASAHYESGRQIINLTKMAGGGSLAHEWAHAMDNIMSVAHDPKSTKGRAFASEGDVSGLPDRVRDAYDDVMKTILYNPDTEPGAAKKVKEFADRRASGDQLSMYEKYIEKKNIEVLEGARSGLYQRSLAMGKGNKQSYWVRKREMFARAFESYIHDELANKGRESSYLVSGTKVGGPYPVGEERNRINAAMKKLVGAIRETESLEKSLQKLYIRL